MVLDAPTPNNYTYHFSWTTFLKLSGSVYFNLRHFKRPTSTWKVNQYDISHVGCSHTTEVFVKLGQVSRKFATAKNGQVSSKFAAAINGQVSSKIAAAKNGQVSSKFAASRKIEKKCRLILLF